MGVKKVLAIIAGVVTSLAGFVAMFLLGKKVGYNEPLSKREDIKDGMEKAREDKKHEIESTDAHSLVEQSSDAAGHRSRINEHQESFKRQRKKRLKELTKTVISRGFWRCLRKLPLLNF